MSGCYVKHSEGGRSVRCDRPVVALGLCEADYTRLRRAGGDIEKIQGSPPIRPVEWTSGCQAGVDFEELGTFTANEIRGLELGGGDILLSSLAVASDVDPTIVDLAEAIVAKRCCQSPHHSGGFCAKHYSRLRRTGTTNRTRGRNAGETCLGSPASPECSSPAVRRGRCENCYYNVRYHEKKKQRGKQVA